jgi:hypothetical protein
VARSSRAFSDHFSCRQLIFVLPLWVALVGCGFAAATQTLHDSVRAALLAALTAVALFAPVGRR